MHGFEHLAAAAGTDVGLRRKNNEDAYGVLKSCGVFVVADGMGGGAEGEYASRATVDELSRAMERLSQGTAPPAQESKCAHIQAACNHVCSEIQERVKATKADQMGSTIVAVSFDAAAPGKACVLHAGDSRAYRFRNERLNQLSKDHSVGEAVGARSEKELPAMFRGVLTRAVGLERAVQLEQTIADVEPGDLLLLCTDGLTRMVSDRKLRSLLNAAKDDTPEVIVQTLIKAALAAGGRDNVTALVIKVGELPEPIPVAPPDLPEEDEADSGPPTETPTRDSWLDTDFSQRSSDQMTPPSPPATDEYDSELDTPTPPETPPRLQPSASRMLTGFGRRARKWSRSRSPAWLLIGLACVVVAGWGWRITRQVEQEPEAERPFPSVPTQLTLLTAPMDGDPTPVRVSLQAEESAEWQRVSDDSIAVMNGSYRVRFERVGYLSQEKAITVDGQESVLEVRPDDWVPGMQLATLMRAEAKLNAAEPDLQAARTEIEAVEGHSWTSEHHAGRKSDLLERIARLDAVEQAQIEELEAGLAEVPTESDITPAPEPEPSGEILITTVAEWPEEAALPVGHLADDTGAMVKQIDVAEDARQIALPVGRYHLVLNLPGHESLQTALDVHDRALLEWQVPEYAAWQPKQWLQHLRDAEAALAVNGVDEATRLLALLDAADRVDMEPAFRARLDNVRQQLDQVEQQHFLQVVARAEQESDWSEVVNLLDEHPDWHTALQPHQAAWMDLWSDLSGPDGEAVAEQICQALAEWEEVLMTGAVTPQPTPDDVPEHEKATQHCLAIRQRLAQLESTFDVWLRLADGVAWQATGPLYEGHVNYLWILSSLRLRHVDEELLQSIREFPQQAEEKAGRMKALHANVQENNGLYWLHDIPAKMPKFISELSGYWQKHAQLLQGDHFRYFEQRVSQLTRHGQVRVPNLKPLTPSRLAAIMYAWQHARDAHDFESPAFNYRDWMEAGGVQDYQRVILLFSETGVPGEEEMADDL